MNKVTVDANTQDTDAILFTLIRDANPTATFLEDSSLVSLSEVRRVVDENIFRNYNTEFDIVGNSAKNVNGTVTFRYNRINLGKLAFTGQDSIGVLDVPLLVRENTLEYVKSIFFNLIDDITLVETINDVSKWQITIPNNHRIFTFYSDGYDASNSLVLGNDRDTFFLFTKEDLNEYIDDVLFSRYLK